MGFVCLCGMDELRNSWAVWSTSMSLRALGKGLVSQGFCLFYALVVSIFLSYALVCFVLFMTCLCVGLFCLSCVFSVVDTG